MDRERVAMSSSIHCGRTYFERDGHTKRLVMKAGSSGYLAGDREERRQGGRLVIWKRKRIQ